MFFSAMTLAAILQAAPVALPEAPPVVGRKGYLLQRGPSDPTQTVDQLQLATPKIAPSARPEAVRARRSVASPFKGKPLRRPSPNFLRNPQMVSCDANGLSKAGHPEALKAQPLSELPQAKAERAVVRLVDGCPVAVLLAEGPIGR